MSYCQACDTFREPRKHGSTHVAELAIVFAKDGIRIELHVCLCCWFAIAFRKSDMRRENECSGQIGEAYVYPVSGEDGERWYREIIRARRFTLEKILQNSMDFMAGYRND